MEVLAFGGHSVLEAQTIKISSRLILGILHALAETKHTEMLRFLISTTMKKSTQH